MKTNYALAAVVPTENPQKGSIVHLCFYENEPQQIDVNSLVEELRTDPEFSLVNKECDKDYFLEFFEGEALAQIKKDLNIPDDMPDHGEGGWVTDDENEVKFRTDEK